MGNKGKEKCLGPFVSFFFFMSKTFPQRTGGNGLEFFFLIHVLSDHTTGKSFLLLILECIADYIKWIKVCGIFQKLQISINITKIVASYCQVMG